MAKFASSSQSADNSVLRHLRGFIRLSERVSKPPLVIERGSGVWVFDREGRPYLEAASGMWCASLGFGEPELVEAATEQMNALPYYHTLANRTTGPAEELAQRIATLVPVPDAQVHFAVSGSEASDFAVKFLRYANNALGHPERKTIISREGGYHGATLAATSLTGMERYHQLFDVPLPGFRHTLEPHYYRNHFAGESESDFIGRLADVLEEAVIADGEDTVAGFFAEPVTGGGGVVVPPAGYYDAVQRVLAAHNVAFIADEIINGFGRTGSMFGVQTMGIRPDIMTLGKGMSGGYLPIAAVVISGEIADALSHGSDQVGTFAHGATQSGNPVAAAVALKVLDLMEQRRILEHVTDVAPHFATRLDRFATHPNVGDVRHVGLIGAIEFMADPKTRTRFEPWGSIAARIASAAQEAGLLVRAAARGDTITFSPPLIISEAEIDEMFDRFEAAVSTTMRSWVWA